MLTEEKGKLASIVLVIVGLLALIVCMALLAGTAGCSSQQTQHFNNSPLATSGSVAPPPGCKDLRKRGGSC